MSVKRQFGHICPPGKYWYSCSTGYAGCCSMVACTSNRCDDDDLEDSSSGSSSSSPSRMSPESSTSPPAVATAHAGDGPGEDSSESSPSSSTSPPKSDSGVTHTIPNDSTVTVTRHTTITRGLSTTATDSASTFTTQAGNNSTTSSLGPPSPTQTAVGSGVPGSGINSGTVVGIAVGGVFAVALLVGLLFLWRSRRNRGLKEVETTHEPAFIDKASLHDNIFGRRPTSASLPRHPTPQQASDNGQGYGYDPFAPFGGRADRPASTSPPPLPNTFEMDGRGVQVVELPGTALTTTDNEAKDRQRQETRSVGAVKQRPSSDPRATLNHLPRENGHPTYVNHWNQYSTGR